MPFEFIYTTRAGQGSQLLFLSETDPDGFCTKLDRQINRTVPDNNKIMPESIVPAIHLYLTLEVDQIAQYANKSHLSDVMLRKEVVSRMKRSTHSYTCVK
jgi:hypothetical protein